PAQVPLPKYPKLKPVLAWATRVATANCIGVASKLIKSGVRGIAAICPKGIHRHHGPRWAYKSKPKYRSLLYSRSRIYSRPILRPRDPAYLGTRFEETRVPNKLISVVDDDASVRWATVDLLASVGFACEAFESAETYLQSDTVDRTSCLIL